MSTFKRWPKPQSAWVSIAILCAAGLAGYAGWSLFSYIIGEIIG